MRAAPRLGHLASLLALALVGCGVEGPSGRLLDTDRLETSLSEQLGEDLRDQLGRESSADLDVRCPDDVVASFGGVFSCRATVAGQRLDVTVIQGDAAGRLELSRRQAVIDTGVAAAELAERISEQQSVAVTVDCGADRVLVAEPPASFTCQAAYPDGRSRRVDAIVADAAGSVEFRLDPATQPAPSSSVPPSTVPPSTVPPSTVP